MHSGHDLLHRILGAMYLSMGVAIVAGMDHVLLGHSYMLMGMVSYVLSRA